MNICGRTPAVSPRPSFGRVEGQTAEAGAAEGSEDKGCRTLGWQEVASFGLGAVGRADGQEFSAAPQSAKQQRLLASHSVSEALVPTWSQPAAEAQG